MDSEGTTAFYWTEALAEPFAVVEFLPAEREPHTSQPLLPLLGSPALGGRAHEGLQLVARVVEETVGHVLLASGQGAGQVITLNSIAGDADAQRLPRLRRVDPQRVAAAVRRDSRETTRPLPRKRSVSLAVIMAIYASRAQRI